LLQAFCKWIKNIIDHFDKKVVICGFGEKAKQKPTSFGHSMF